MFTFIKTIIIAGMIAFPIIKGVFKGTSEFNVFKGIVFGIHYDSIFFGAMIDKEERTFQLHTLSFHAFCFTLTMACSVERPDVEIEKE